ncbi:hypothetical protein BDY17DRAFT_28021 [Neohortaea acidophila]|uniref:Zn(2)-C6 fungal-type domain-containing protein n=1 Tax=Neohortaea acidophila TaxID=245834 RepID=A0A6A6PIZ0_9PEZI|nr:uncharacterized protein BDY17DRAFT_28021 [Neohortaea acidophila]KAF2479885.1 hypothetical protein BDY17DRAFT_28021 [Neohortaea acidophila]
MLPMQELATNSSVVNGSEKDQHGLAQSPSANPSSAAFTAVNGAIHSSALFRPREASLTSIDRPASFANAAATTDQYSPVRPSGERDSPPMTGKRKREGQLQTDVPSHDAARAINGQDDAPGSPPRHALPTLDSAIDLTSAQFRDPSRSSGSPFSDSSARLSTQRARSPKERWNQGAPPPKPRPETEASISASLQQFQQQSQQTQDVRRSSPTTPRAPSIPGERDDRTSVPAQSDDTPNSGDYMDPKRRKRNFSNRTKTGCHTCRRRKKKCDERKPTCINCERGAYACEGYGAKPSNFKVSTRVLAANSPPSKPATSPHVARRRDEPSMGTAEGRSYSHWGRISPPGAAALPQPTSFSAARAPAPLPPTLLPPPEPELPRAYVRGAPPSSKQMTTSEAWPNFAFRHHDTTSRQVELPPPPGFPSTVPLHSPHSLHDARTSHSMPPYPQLSIPTPRPPTTPLQPPPPLQHQLPPQPISTPVEVWHQPPPNSTIHPPYQPSSYTTSVLNPISRRASTTTKITGTSQPPPNTLPLTHTAFAEKDKMLRSQPYQHYFDPVLLQDRKECHAACDRYNASASSLSTSNGNTSSSLDRGRLFDQILKPHKRPEAPGRQYAHTAPVGSVEDHSLIESPFKCEFGYNVHIGRECVVDAGCYFQDAADISLGHGVTLGPGVKLYCVTVPGLEAGTRGGSHGRVLAGAIRIEDDVFIGGEAIIMPFVTVGRGAHVGAGSVVTKVRLYSSPLRSRSRPR